MIWISLETKGPSSVLGIQLRFKQILNSPYLHRLRSITYHFCPYLLNLHIINKQQDGQINCLRLKVLSFQNIIYEQYIIDDLGNSHIFQKIQSKKNDTPLNHLGQIQNKCYLKLKYYAIKQTVLQNKMMVLSRTSKTFIDHIIRTLTFIRRPY